MTMNIKGLRFCKIDLHVHTPGSEDFADRSVTPKQIVQAAIDKGLTGIAITDHQTGSWIDDMKKAAEGTGLTIFPGVELKVHGGESGIHLIALFDIDKTTKHIDAFLNTLKAYEKDGKPKIITNTTAVQVARELKEFDPSAILSLAHCQSGQGVISDMRGEQRNELFVPELTSLLGAEARQNDFTDPQKIKDGKRIVDLFDGGYEGFHYKKLGVYQVSDAHSLADIGSKYSYFKIDDPLSIEDIRQCLIDSSTRIRQPNEYQDHSYPYIESMSVTSGFLKDQTVVLHQGLNSLLGAKGAGKSLVVEFLRFALDQQPNNQDVYRDHISKIDKCLKTYGAVSVIFADGTGKRYKITRTYKPLESSPTVIIDLSDGSIKNFDIEKLFPVLFLSQNEIVKIAEDESNKSQRQFIDRFFDFHKYQEEIESRNNQLKDIDTKVAESIKSSIKTNSLQVKINTYREEIDKLGKQITNAVFDKYSSQEKIGNAIRNKLEFLATLRGYLDNTLSEYSEITIPVTGNEKVDSDPAVTRAAEAALRVVNDIPDKINASIKLLDEKSLIIKQELIDWESAFAEIKTEYEGLVEKSGGNQVVLDQKRKLQLEEVARLERSLAIDSHKASLLPERMDQRNKVVAKLDQAYKDYFEERQRRCELFTSSSEGTLNVSMAKAGDTSAFYSNLQNLKKGSYLKDEMVKKVAESMSPKVFVDLIIKYELSGRRDIVEFEKQSKIIGIEIEELVRLTNHLLDSNTYEDILALMYNSIPEDVPTISYKVDGIQKPLEELSVGQKAVTLLIIALSDGNFPIVVDQPEDSLDLRTIWEDVCKKLRGAKDRRQFVFTTHNSSVAVASDSDMFVILQSNAKSGKVLYSGSINNTQVKKEVINYLEGGEKTYFQKREKYNL